MESDMIEEMVKDVNDGSVRIKTIVGDEASTMISKLWTKLTQILLKHWMLIMLKKS